MRIILEILKDHRLINFVFSLMIFMSQNKGLSWVAFIRSLVTSTNITNTNQLFAASGHREVQGALSLFLAHLVSTWLFHPDSVSHSL